MKALRIFWIISIFFIMGCNDNMEKINDFIEFGCSFDLSKEEIKNYSKEAIEGSTIAAEKLYFFYSLSNYSGYIEENRLMSNYWCLIGAINGSPNMMEILAQTYIKDKTNRNNLERSLYWLEKAKMAGSPKVERDIEQLKILIEKL